MQGFEKLGRRIATYRCLFNDPQSRMNLMDVMKDKTVAYAIMDRVSHQAIRIELFGESLRKRRNLDMQHILLQ